MPEIHERMQCSVCGTFWEGDIDTCPVCGTETFPYTIEIEDNAPENFERAMAMLRRHRYGDVADYCELLREEAAAVE